MTTNSAMELFNFFHGLSGPRTLSFGWFDIEVTQLHCDNLKLLPRNASNSFTFDGEMAERKVQQISASRGQLAATGTLHLNHLGMPSALMSDRDEVTQAFDAVLLLSFLTGRRVYLESELQGDVVHRYFDGAVDRHFFRLWNGSNIDLSKVGPHLASALYNIVNAYTAPELIGMAAYANISLEAVASHWLKANKATKYSESGAIQRCLSEFSAWIQGSLHSSARARILSLMEGEEVSRRVIQDIEARIRSNASQPSAIYKIESFFSGIGLLRSPPTIEQSERVTKLNKLRNAVAHRGDINRRNGTNSNHTAEVAFGITMLEIEIVQYYLAAHVLGIEYRSLNQTLEELKTFFDSGMYHGQDLFNEKYDDFIAKAEEDWIERGLLR